MSTISLQAPAALDRPSGLDDYYPAENEQSIQTLDHPRTMSRSDIDRAIIARAMRDQDFRNQLVADPKSVMERELSAIAGKQVRFPDDFEIRVVEENDNVAYLVLPARAHLGTDNQRLSTDELDPEGGIAYYCTTVTCKPGWSC